MPPEEAPLERGKRARQGAEGCGNPNGNGEKGKSGGAKGKGAEGREGEGWKERSGRERRGTSAERKWIEQHEAEGRDGNLPAWSTFSPKCIPCDMLNEYLCIVRVCYHCMIRVCYYCIVRVLYDDALSMSIMASGLEHLPQTFGEHTYILRVI